MVKLVTLFFSHVPSCRYVYPDGSEAAFIGGRYATDDPEKISQLQHEIEKGHPLFHQDPNKLEIDEKELDPFEAMKRKIIADAIAAGEIQAMSTSTSEQGNLNPSSSATLVDVKTPEELILEATKEAPKPAVDLSALLKK